VALRSNAFFTISAGKDEMVTCPHDPQWIALTGKGVCSYRLYRIRTLGAHWIREKPLMFVW